MQKHAKDPQALFKSAYLSSALKLSNPLTYQQSIPNSMTYSIMSL